MRPTGIVVETPGFNESDQPSATLGTHAHRSIRPGAALRLSTKDFWTGLSDAM